MFKLMSVIFSTEFVPAHCEHKWKALSYADKTREKRRVAQMALNEVRRDQHERERSHKQKLRQQQAQKNASWSDNTARKALREKRRSKKAAARRAIIEKHQTRSDASISNGVSRQSVEDDWEDLAEEERMAKKVRRGEMPPNEFDAQYADID